MAYPRLKLQWLAEIGLAQFHVLSMAEKEVPGTFVWQLLRFVTFYFPAVLNLSKRTPVVCIRPLSPGVALEFLSTTKGFRGPFLGRAAAFDLGVSNNRSRTLFWMGFKGKKRNHLLGVALNVLQKLTTPPNVINYSRLPSTAHIVCFAWNMAVAQKTGIPKWLALLSGNNYQNLRNPSCLMVSHTHLFFEQLWNKGSNPNLRPGLKSQAE